MENLVINKLNQLKEQIACKKKYRCLVDIAREPQAAKYHALSDLMECLDDQSSACKFSTAFGESFMCRCPLRKFAAINFDALFEKNNSE